ncbi:hypothetical protein [Nocardiopsis sp. CA-288880]|uniref:hypothetical protein n=1 Tax=Nocardiopsis sp. CA-288880 TaxID=3239995 RepID=UPI003D9A0ACA
MDAHSPPPPRREHTPDPLVSAIAAGTLTESQRAALADLVALLSQEMASTFVARPGTLMDRTIEEAGSWATVRAAWRQLQPGLYPQATVS